MRFNMKPVLLTLTLLTFVAKVTLAVTPSETTTARVGGMCEKTVRELVPKVVQKRIIVAVRSTRKCGFLWLNTCSTYRNGYKTVPRTEYVVETVTKLVCCNGTDVNGTCATDKPSCSVDGKYGPDCDSECDCDANHTLPEVCDKGSGYCFCLPGYGGEACRQDLNQTTSPGYDPALNVTESYPPGESQPEVSGGGDVISRIIIIVIILVVIFVAVVIAFCCWSRRIRRKTPTSDGSTVSDDFVLSLNPAQDSAQYVTPEEVRKRKKEQEAMGSGEPEKPYDYVEMRSVSGARPTLSGASEKPEVTSMTSSLAHKALEQEVDSGRLSLAYANIPSSGSVKQDVDTSHYYLEDADPNLSSSPTYSLMRRQESGDSAFDDDGYCTSPTHMAEDLNLHYSIPRYLKDKNKPFGQKLQDASLPENIYESPDRVVRPVTTQEENKSTDPPEYANVGDCTLPNGLYSHLPGDHEHDQDGYDHLSKSISVV